MSAELYKLTLTTYFCTGMNFLQWYGPQAQLIITEPELVKQILSNKDRAYPKTKVSSEIKKLLGDGIVLSEGEKWVKLRKLANHAFHGESIKVNSFFGFEL
jgi:PHYB activation tagged suppressor 1